MTRGSDAISSILALSYSISMLAYAGCLVPLALLQRDLKRAGVAPYAASMTFALKAVVFVVLADVAILVLALSFGVGEAMVAPASALAALIVVTLAYVGKRRQLRSGSHQPPVLAERS